MDGLILAAQIERVATRKDHTVSVSLGLQEMTPAKAGELMTFGSKLVCVYISPKETITQKELDQIDQLKPEFPGKSQSQRIRAVLFVAWEKKPDGFKEFDGYYKFHTEAFIDLIKSKIDP